MQTQSDAVSSLCSLNLHRFSDKLSLGAQPVVSHQPFGFLSLLVCCFGGNKLQRGNCDLLRFCDPILAAMPCEYPQSNTVVDSIYGTVLFELSRTLY